MFELTDRDVFRLVEMFGSSDATFMQVKVGDVEVVLSRRNHDGPPSLGRAPAATPGAAPSAPGAAPSAPPPEAPAAPAADPPGDLVTVTAPTLGTFYSAPRPDLPPYVQVGSTVEPDSTVGLIEAMKVFTGVSAGVSGTVAEVLVGSGDFVEYGQPLMRLAPSAPDGAAT